MLTAIWYRRLATSTIHWLYRSIGASLPTLRPPTLSHGLKRASRLRRSLLTATTDGLGFRRVALWTARWSQRLLCFLWDTLLVRAGLLIGG
jgi:hypothetical protein